MNKLMKKSAAIILMLCLILTMMPMSVFAAGKIHLNKKSAYVYIDMSYNLKLIGANGKKIPNKKIAWTSNNKRVAKVNKNGVVTGVSEGVARITAKYKKKKYAFIANVRKPYTEEEIKALIQQAQSEAEKPLTEEEIKAIIKEEMSKNPPTTTVVSGGGSSLTEEQVKKIAEEEAAKAKEEAEKAAGEKAGEEAEKSLDKYGYIDREAFTKSDGISLKVFNETDSSEIKCEDSGHSISVKNIEAKRFDFNKTFRDKYYKYRVEVTFTGSCKKELMDLLDDEFEAFIDVANIGTNEEGTNEEVTTEVCRGIENPHQFTENDDGTFTMKYAVYTNVENANACRFLKWRCRICTDPEYPN